jgi:hypothetical protein
MKPKSSVEALWKVLILNADEDGYLSANIDYLCMWSGLSRSTVKRALEELQRQKRLSVGSRRGRIGGLVFKIENGPKMVHENGPKMVHENAPCNAFQKNGSGAEGPEPEPFFLREMVQQNGSAETPVSAERTRQWVNAISSALREGLRHSEDCGRGSHALKGCPYCEYVHHRMGKAW